MVRDRATVERLKRAALAGDRQAAAELAAHGASLIRTADPRDPIVSGIYDEILDAMGRQATRFLEDGRPDPVVEALRKGA